MQQPRARVLREGRPVQGPTNLQSRFPNGGFSALSSGYQLSQRGLATKKYRTVGQYRTPGRLSHRSDQRTTRPHIADRTRIKFRRADDSKLSTGEARRLNSRAQLRSRGSFAAAYDDSVASASVRRALATGNDCSAFNARRRRCVASLQEMTMVRTGLLAGAS